MKLMFAKARRDLRSIRRKIEEALLCEEYPTVPDPTAPPAVQLRYLLSQHLIRILVFSNSKEDRLTETVIPCPFREFNLADRRRFNPVTTLQALAIIAIRKSLYTRDGAVLT
jgi:hypothetical protein